jgi:hypothetical protein
LGFNPRNLHTIDPKLIGALKLFEEQRDRLKRALADTEERVEFLTWAVKQEQIHRLIGCEALRQKRAKDAVI